MPKEKIIKKKIICFFCGDETKGKAHKQLCLGWKKDIKKVRKLIK